MDLATLAQLGEFVGGVFVVISLVYLAHQVRQNTNSLKTENYARVLERMSTLQSNLSTDPELNRVVVVGAQDPADLSRSERIRFSWAMYELLGAAEFMYEQAQEGAMPDEVWQRWDATLVWWLSNPGIQAWWKAKPSPFTASFETHVNEVIRADPFDAEVAARWARFVTGEPSATERPAAET